MDISGRSGNVSPIGSPRRVQHGLYTVTEHLSKSQGFYHERGPFTYIYVSVVGIAAREARLHTGQCVFASERRPRTCECENGQRAANVYNINANGLPYTLYTGASSCYPTPPRLVRPQLPSAPKYGVIFMGACKLMHQGACRSNRG